MLSWPVHPSQRGLIEDAPRGIPSGLNCAFAYRIRGPVDVKRLLNSYRQVIGRLDALRLILDDDSRSACWKLSDRPRAEVSYHDVLLAEGETSADEFIAPHAREVFDLRSGRVGSITIWRWSASEYLVSEVFHHALADGRSLAVLHAWVADFYNEGRFPAPGLAYGELLAAADDPALQTAAREFWRDHFAGFCDPAVVPVPPPDQPASASLRLAPAAVSAIGRAAGKMRSTLAAVLFAAHAHAAARLAGTGDIAVFLPVDTRAADKLPVFGQATLLLPVRVRHVWEQTVSAHQAAVSRSLLSARDYLAIDADMLDQCGAPVSLSAPTANVFVFQDQPAQPPSLHGLNLEAIRQPELHHAGGFVTAARAGAGGGLAITVRTGEGAGCYHARAAQIAEIMMAYLRALQDSPETALGTDALLDSRSAGLAATACRLSAPYPYVPVAGLITERLRGDPWPVLTEDGRTWTSRELLDHVRSREAELSNSGVLPGHAVVCADDTQFRRIASFIAILRMGAVYVPADAPCDPATRTQIEHRCQSLRAWQQPPVPAAPGPAAHGLWGIPGDCPAYVIFTSGSTGQPKGVVISQAALSNLAQGEPARFGIGAGSRVLLIAPPTTDPWICHVTGALVSGATLIAASVLSGVPLADQIARNQVTHAFLPAVLLSQVDARTSPSLQMVATAGDHCRPEDVERLLPLRVVNIYGPTEGTVTSTTADLHSARPPVPIGRPIRGAGARVVIDGKATAPTGVAGELALYGTGLALGYLGADEAAQARFREDPLQDGQRTYATGDLAWLGDDGQFYLHGRIDRQVKIRGFRVEPGQIEAVARASRLCSDAHAAAAVGQAFPGAARLLLFAEQCPEPDQLLEYLRQSLPHFMVPASVIQVGRLPRLPSGKVDASRLPDATAAGRHGSSGEEAAYDEAAEPAEHALARAWQRVLGTVPARDDHFFSQGGDSLAALRLTREARDSGIPLTLAQVYHSPRFTDLTASVKAPGAPPGSSTGWSGLIPLSPSQRWFFSLRLPAPDQWSQSCRLRFSSLPDPSGLRSALGALLRCTPILRAKVCPDGIGYQPDSPVTPPHLIILPQGSQPDIPALAGRLREHLSPAQGRNLAAAAIREKDGGGTLLLVAHHLVVDDWSWPVIEQRLRAALPGAAGTQPARDDVFAAYARALEAQYQVGAFDLDQETWDGILASGRSAAGDSRPGHLQRLTASVPGDFRAQAARRGMPLAALLLACLGHALAAAEPDGATIVDLERNGRGAVDGLDTAAAVGWFALHHPVRVPHVPVSAAGVAYLAAALQAVPAGGAGYGAHRWRETPGSGGRSGRFSVNISIAGVIAPRTGPAGRVTASAPGPSNAPPYEAAFVFRLAEGSLAVECSFDPDRLPAAVITSVAESLTAALSALARDTASVPSGRSLVQGQLPFGQPIPAGIIQELMLEAAQVGAGVYRPRQLLVVRDAGDPGRFFSWLARFLGSLDPFRRRFSPSGTGFLQHVLPPAPLPLAYRPGGLDSALAWLQGPDEVSPEAAADGGPVAHLAAFTCGNGQAIAALQVHHAILDGVSNNRLLGLIQAALDAGRPDGPGPAFHAEHAMADQDAVRKHVAAERRAMPAARPGRGTGSAAGGFVPLRDPWTEETVLSSSRLARVMSHAGDLSVDARAMFAAAALEVSRQESPGRPVYLVCNGRDPDIPETQHAMGLFWYFIPVMPGTGPLPALAAQVFALAGQPASRLRSLTAESRDWRENSAMSFNFTKPGASRARAGSITVISHRELFHFRTQIHVALQADQTARLTLVSYDARSRGPAHRMLDRYLDALGQIAGE